MKVFGGKGDKVLHETGERCLAGCGIGHLGLDRWGWSGCLTYAKVLRAVLCFSGCMDEVWVWRLGMSA
jgi:hypothetical protein